MLCLTRKVGEVIVVNGPCRIVLVQSDRGRSRIGIEADREVLVLREELIEKPKTADDVA